jgi:hypothetical protein
MMVINPDSVMAVTEFNGKGNATENNNTRNNTPTGNED